jgi:hypothetical protein
MSWKSITTSLTVLSVALSFFCCGCATSSHLAVVRGQATVDKSTLPFVCFGVGTVGYGMPIYSVQIRNIKTSEVYTSILSKTFGNEHPDYLTAISGTSVLSLIVLKVPPGDYRFEEIEYNGITRDLLQYTFDLTKMGTYKFHIAPDTINYIGSIEITIPWGQFQSPLETDMFSNRLLGTSFRCAIAVNDTAQRDHQWSKDQIPALVDQPFVYSKIDVSSADQKSR